MNEKVAKKIETKSELDKAFVDTNDKVLDPTLLKKILTRKNAKSIRMAFISVAI